MSILSKMRRFSREKLLIDINRYNPAQSPDAMLRRILETNCIDLVVDVGANDGGYAKRILSSGFSGRILSIEPLDEEWASLNRQAVKYQKWHIAERCALGATNTTGLLNVAKNRYSSSLLEMSSLHVSAAPDSMYQDVKECHIRRLDDLDSPLLVDAKKIFLKIDSQGYESEVLKGAEGLIEKIYGLQLELSLDRLYVGQKLALEMITMVENLGFAFWGIERGFFDEKNGRMLQFDGIFIRK